MNPRIKKCLLLILLVVAIAIIVIVANIAYVKAVVNSDLPGWLKFILLCSK